MSPEVILYIHIHINIYICVCIYAVLKHLSALACEDGVFHGLLAGGEDAHVAIGYVHIHICICICMCIYVVLEHLSALGSKDGVHGLLSGGEHAHVARGARDEAALFLGREHRRRDLANVEAAAKLRGNKGGVNRVKGCERE